MSIRFGTSRDGMPIEVQIVSIWLAESTLSRAASLLESISAVHDFHPVL
ncbi:hypothetical protein [Variovorax sp. PAMC26660]|nr:hypothetical protein [Variovorax sp. PAMC26660]QNK65833.1 hypothetical protein H7F35_21795 [Variovorax sp. PAMC26660]